MGEKLLQSFRDRFSPIQLCIALEFGVLSVVLELVSHAVTTVKTKQKLRPVKAWATYEI